MTVSLVAILCVGFAVGACIGRWWALAIPLVVGTGVAAALAAGGQTLADTPIAFLVVVVTAALGSGVLLRRHASGATGFH